MCWYRVKEYAPNINGILIHCSIVSRIWISIDSMNICLEEVFQHRSKASISAHNLFHSKSSHAKALDTVNSLVPGRFKFNFRLVIFKLNLVNGGWGISYEVALIWMPLNPTDDKSTSVQVMAWCRKATSHYLSQCWPRSMSPNGVTRPQSVFGFIVLNNYIILHNLVIAFGFISHFKKLTVQYNIKIGTCCLIYINIGYGDPEINIYACNFHIHKRMKMP